MVTTSEQPAATPKELHLLRHGGRLMGLGAAATACIWSFHAARPIPHGIYSSAITITVVMFLVGAFFAVILSAAQWVVKAIGRQQSEAAEQQTRALRDIAARLTGISASVGHNGYLARQVLAARTVDLQAMSDQIEGTARNLTVNAIADLEKSSGSRYQALTDQVAELGATVKELRLAFAQAYVDSLGEPPAQLRAVPSPRGRWTQEQP